MEMSLNAFLFCWSFVSFTVYGDVDYNFEDILETQQRINDLKLKILKEIKNNTEINDCFTCSCPEPLKGDKGHHGAVGSPGSKGKKGEQGYQGRRGPPCFNRPQGYEKPLKGYRGDPGLKGRAGPRADMGKCTCNDTEEECPVCPQKKWGSRGEFGKPGEPGTQGQKGAKGLPGENCAP